MKKLLGCLFCTMLFSSVLYCQEVFVNSDAAFERQSEQWVFTNVITVDSLLTKEQLFQKVKQWFSESFVSSKNVIDNADKDEGVIYGHAIIMITANSTYGHIDFNIEVRCKDGKVKCVLRDFMHREGQVVNAYGEHRVGFGTFDIGSLAQKEVPEWLGYNQTGRSKRGRDKLWNEVKNTSKISAFNLIQSLKSNLKKESIKEKDSW